MSSDHDEADALLARDLLLPDRPALVVAICPAGKERHTLGKVVGMPDGHRIAVRGFKIRTQDFYVGRPVEPNGQPVKQRDATYPVDDVEAGDILARCKHGTYLIHRAELPEAVARARKTGKTVYMVTSWTGPPGWTGHAD